MKNNLKALRVAKGLTQEEVATRLRFTTQNLISRQENGQASSSIRDALQLAKIFGIEVEKSLTLIIHRGVMTTLDI